MKILVTGATGLVGTQFIKDATALGFQINFLTTKRIKTFEEKNIKGFYWNPEIDLIEDLSCFDDVKYILHLCGFSVDRRWTKNNRKKIIDSRVKTLQLLKQTIEKNNIKINHIISASAIGLYPSSKTNIYTEEENKYEQYFLTDVIKKWEAAAQSFNSLEMKVSIIRIGLVMSIKGGVLEKIIKSMEINRIAVVFGDGSQWQSWIHIKDLSSIFLFVINKKLSGIYNAVAPNPITNFEMVRILKDNFDYLYRNNHYSRSTSLRASDRIEFYRKIFIYFTINVPKFIFKLLFGKMHEILFLSHKVSSQKLSDAGFVFEFPDFEKMIKEINQ